MSYRLASVPAALLLLVSGCAGQAEGTGSGEQNLENESSITAGCGAGDWSAPVPRFDTIAGSYSATANDEDLQTISFDVTTDADNFRAGGSFSATSSRGPLHGAFVALPDNPAFPRSIMLEPTGGTTRVYYVLGVKNEDAKLSAMCLSYMADARTPGAPFVLERTAE